MFRVKFEMSEGRKGARVAQNLGATGPSRATVPMFLPVSHVMVTAVQSDDLKRCGVGLPMKADSLLTGLN
jgi:hypothetical protein